MTVKADSDSTLDKHSADIVKFSATSDEMPNKLAIEKIMEFCEHESQTIGVSENVACSDKIELIRIRNGFAKNVLWLDAASAEKGLQRVCEKMQDAYPVKRVTFLYLLAEMTDCLETLT